MQRDRKSTTLDLGRARACFLNINDYVMETDSHYLPNLVTRVYLGDK